MRVFGVTQPPYGFVELCQRNPEECRLGPQEEQRFSATPDRLSELDAINQFVNHEIVPATDLEIYGQTEYWTLPGTRGDCEDFAIAKYAMLLLGGMEVDKLRLTYVKAKLRGAAGEHDQAHMVLAYYPAATAEPVILDNIVPDILPASRRTDLTPVFGFNSKGLWVGGAVQPASTRPAARLSRWNDLLRRAAREGLK